MEIADDVNLFPTEVQEVKISNQSQEERDNKIERLQETQNFDSNSKIEDSEDQSGQKVSLDSILNESQKLTGESKTDSLDNYNNNNSNKKAIISIQSNHNTKRIPRTCPQTAQKHPIFPKKNYNIITKPKTSSSSKSSLSMKRGKISPFSTDKYLPQNLINNPIISRRYGIYTAKEIVSRPPRAALDSSEYKPKVSVELSELAQSILDGNRPDKEASQEELKEAKSQLKKLELELIDKTDYMAAKKAAAAYDYMEKYVNRNQEVQKLKENLEDILSKRNELIAYIESIQETIQMQLEEQKIISDERLKELENQQTIEIQEFDENVPTELTKEFRHQTKDYLDLRIKQRSLAMKREFDEAQKLKEKADKIEKLQIKGDIIQMKKYYKRKRKLILRKHRIQIQCLMDDDFLRKKEILNSRQFEIDSTKARIQALDDEVKRKCEEKGVDITELDDRKVDQQRVDDLISRSNETRYAKFRPRLSSALSNPLPQYASLRQPLPLLSAEA